MTYGVSGYSTDEPTENHFWYGQTPDRRRHGWFYSYPMSPGSPYRDDGLEGWVHGPFASYQAAVDDWLENRGAQNEAARERAARRAAGTSAVCSG